MKSTKEITSDFYQAMMANNGWESYFTEGATYLGPLAGLIEGREAVVGVTSQFLERKFSGEVKSIIAEGDNSCVLTHYQIGHPSAALLEVDACEIIKIENGKVASMEVYFDSLKVSAFGEKMKQIQG